MDKQNILFSSRYRSGAPNHENIENQPPSVQSKATVLEKPPPVEGGQKSVNFGSKVSKIKEMFQAGGGAAAGGKANAPVLTTPAPPPSDLDRSPVSKKQKMNSPERRPPSESKLANNHLSPETKANNVPEQPDPTLLEATNHVQRFNYTRALFARMEADTKKEENTKSKTAYRKSSPIRVLPRSPVLSPLSSGPTSPESKSYTTIDFSQGACSQRMSRRDSGSSTNKTLAPSSYHSRDRSNSDQSRNRYGRDYARSRTASDSTNDTVESINTSEDRKISSSSSNTDASPRSNTSDLLVEEPPVTKTYLRRRSQMSAGEEGSRDRTGKFYGNLGMNNNNTNSSDTSVKSGMKPDPADRVSKLNLRSNLNQNQNEVAHRSRQSLDSTSTHSKNSELQDSSMKKNRGARSQDVDPSRRLSRDDIQAAMAKADAYLAHLSAPKTSDSDSKHKRRSWDPRDHKDNKYNFRRRSLDARDSQESKSSSGEIVNNVNGNEGSSDVVDRMEVAHSEPVKSHIEVGSLSKNIEIDNSIVSIKSPLAMPPKPALLPKRAAPPPPNKPSTSVTASVTRPSAPPPPAPKPGLQEENTPEPSTAEEETEEQDYQLTNGNDSWTGNDPPSYEEAMRVADPVLIVENSDISSSAQPNIFDAAESEADILSKREDGDGHEDPDLPLPHELDGEVTFLPQDNFIEINGLSSTDEDSSDDEIEFKKASKIRFSRSPMKMFPTYSTEDYDRRNEDIDPVAASAEYELEKRVEKMDVFPVDLNKGPEGLGLSIIGMGVGADAGLEKLGIFIKTLTEGGAAQKDGRIAVNDQIIEVDGKSLVGVTQAYAASVLRNTNGTVKFLVGREPDPSKSEVAKLIQQSLEQDRRREEMRRQDQDRLQNLRDEFRPKDEVMEQELHQDLERGFSNRSVTDDSLLEEKGMEDAQEKEEEDDDDDDDDDANEDAEEEDEEEMAAGDATPMSAPSMDTDSVSSPEEMGEKSNVEVFDLQESSSEDTSPDMDPQALFVKLKEAHYKNAVAEAELAKLKAKIILLENMEGQKKQADRKVDEQSLRIRELEKSMESNRKEISQYQDLLEDSQGQYIALEKQMKNDCISLEKKYHKAKKLIKEFQQREKDFIQERESLLQQQTEKDQQYNALVKSLKDRIFDLEKELTTVQSASGLPLNVQTTNDKITKYDIIPVNNSSAPLVQSTSIAGAISPIDSFSEVSSGSEISGSDPILTPDAESPKTPPSFKKKSESIEDLPRTPLLDTTVSKSKAALANSSRRPPTKRSKSTDSELDSNSINSTKDEGDTESHTDTESRTDTESGLETWIKHDSDSTVRKSDSKRRRGQQLSSLMPPTVFPPPPPSAPVLPSSGETDSASEHSHSRQESQSDTSSSISQTSYDPTKPQFRGLDSEIPTGANDIFTDSGAITLVSAKPTSHGFGLPKFSLKPKPMKPTSNSNSSIVLVSKRHLDSNDSLAETGGITLLSRTPIDTGYSNSVTSSTSDITSSMMVSEFDEDGAKSTYTLNISGTPAAEENLSPNKRNMNQYESCSIQDWTSEHVCHWLIGLELEKYCMVFKDRNITGSQLFSLDGSKLKSLGVINSKDREVLKKRIKEMKTTLEKEKKQQEKERKAREKEQKRQSKKK